MGSRGRWRPHRFGCGSRAARRSSTCTVALAGSPVSRSPTMVWIHPAIGAVAVSLMAWMAIEGLRSRHKKPYASGARRLHRRLAPWAGGLLVLSAFGGTASVYFLRDDLTMGQSWHFKLGWTAALLTAGTWLLSRKHRERPASKRFHPVVGLTALAVATLVAFLGLTMLP